MPIVKTTKKWYQIKKIEKEQQCNCSKNETPKANITSIETIS